MTVLDELDPTAASRGAVLPGAAGEPPDSPDAAAPPRGLSGRLERLTAGAPFLPLAVLFGLNAVDELDRTAFGILAPEIRDDFGLSNTGILGVTTAFGVAVVILTLPLAHQADRRNRVRMATGGAVGWAVFSVLTGLAPAVAVLLLARMGSGLARAVNEPTHNSLLADWYPPASRARVYYVHKLANAVGQISGPLLAGLLASAFTWRAPFFLFAIPTMICVVFALKLREPRRGYWDRHAAGVAEDAEDEKPLPFKDAWKLLWQVRSLRQVYFALPFLSASLLGLATLVNLFWEEVYDLSPTERGFLESGSEAFQLLGILGGAIIIQRLLVQSLRRAVLILAVGGVGAAIGLAMMALSPVLVGSVVGRIVFAVFAVALTPGIYAAGSMVLPARARSLGFSAALIWALPGVLFLPIAGAIGDAHGLRAGILFMLPIYLIGALLLGSAGRWVEADALRNTQATSAVAERSRRLASGGAQKLLSVEGLDVAYGQTQVLFGVDLHVDEGEIVALLGTNGAGKSTVLKAVSGLLPKMAGTIRFDGDDITGLDANSTARRGILQVPGGRGIFPSLTVAENIRAAGWLFRRDKGRMKAATEEALSLFPELKKRWDTPAGALSGGEQQMLSLAQAFISRPRLLMIDELSLGLAPTIVERLLDIVRRIHAQGTTVILVEQNVNTALRLAERAVFMEKGEVRFEGPAAELLERTDILRAVYLQGSGATSTSATPAAEGARAASNGAATNGAAPSARRRRREAASAAEAAAAAVAATDDRRKELLAQPVVLEVRGLVKRYGGVRAVDDASFDLHDGEILGLIGPNGAGKTSIFDLISGFQTVDGGRVLLYDEDITAWPAYARARAGLGRMFQDARLWPSLTVREVIAAALERHVETGDPLSAILGMPTVRQSERRIAARVEELIEVVHVGAFADKFLSELSTGSRRMIEIACLLGIGPKILLLDEPSSGIAQKEAEALGPVLKNVQQELGASILIIEHSMPLLTAVADRLVALDAGRVVTIGTPEEVLVHPQVVESYLGGALG